jgi:hypothetical protein
MVPVIPAASAKYTNLIRCNSAFPAMAKSDEGVRFPVFRARHPARSDCQTQARLKAGNQRPRAWSRFVRYQLIFLFSRCAGGFQLTVAGSNL